ncbi:UDP-glucuronosyltransferase 1A7-like [Lytechinus variegatus]|uniref:UDP-glucuronosyltransferase 1A7-like n=1 Tax=Lytechinus variegatus TaxID=7654 RepID=UPI001BB20A71|nr:UDP-glucuronosyltransferase 1A7-like [Lytechinus variegatus]
MALKCLFKLFTVCLVAGNVAFCDSAKVLFVGLFGGGSHMMALIPIGRSLVDRGHEVTFLVNHLDTEKYAQSKYTDYFKFEHHTYKTLDQEFTHIDNQIVNLAFSGNIVGQLRFLTSLFADLNTKVCESIFRDKDLMTRLEGIDAVVVDVYWPCGIYMKSFIAKKTKTTIHGIVVSPTASNSYIQQLAGSPVNPSYQPMSITGLSSNMMFLQRVINTISYLVGNIFNYIMIEKPYHGIVDEYRLDPALKKSIQDDVDLYLINTEFCVEFPFSLMPNVVPVGGLTTEAAKPLDDELESFMGNSGEPGVIVFSFGSTFTIITKSKPELTQVFMDAFGRLPHKVLFHLQTDLPDDVPENIKVLTWLPLQDVLGHPKTRLLVYHGGNNGFLEAVYHGVPLVVMPLIGDQIDVAARVKTMGLGTTLDKMQLSADYIYQTLSEALQNPEYGKNVKRASAIFKDRPMTAPDRAAFWIEHVIKHGGSYMRSPAHDLSFIQYYLLDVILVITFVFLTIMYLVYKLLRLCLKTCLHITVKGKFKND